MWLQYNANTFNRRGVDCTVRAIAVVTDQGWDEVYKGLCYEGYKYGDMPHSNAVVAKYMKNRGYKMSLLPDTCPDCYTVEQFCKDHPDGKYLVTVSNNHVVASVDGCYMDTWDSGQEMPIYYFRKDD